MQTNSLSETETKVMNLIKQGKTNEEIACTLFMAISTVKKHATSIYKKIGVKNKIELILKSKN